MRSRCSFFSVPRTAATTHEIAVSQIFPGVPLAVTSVVFFGLTLFLVLNPGKVIDKIGKYLTPALLISTFYNNSKMYCTAYRRIAGNT